MLENSTNFIKGASPPTNYLQVKFCLVILCNVYQLEDIYTNRLGKNKLLKSWLLPWRQRWIIFLCESGRVGGLTVGSPSQPIMSDGSSPPAMGGERRGHNGHTRVEKWAAGRMECRINDICITPNTTVMYDVKNTNTPKKTFCCNGDLITFSRRFMAQCQKYKPDYQFETLCYWLLTCHALHLCHEI